MTEAESLEKENLENDHESLEKLEGDIESMKELKIEVESIMNDLQRREIDYLETNKEVKRTLKEYLEFKQFLKEAKVSAIRLEFDRDSSKVDKVCDELKLKFVGNLEAAKKLDINFSKTLTSLERLEAQKNKPHKRTFETIVGIRDLVLSVQHYQNRISPDIARLDNLKTFLMKAKLEFPKYWKKLKIIMLKILYFEYAIYDKQIKIITDNLAKQQDDRQDLIEKRSELIKRQEAISTEIEKFCSELGISWDEIKKEIEDLNQSKQEFNENGKQNKNWKYRILIYLRSIQQSKINFHTLFDLALNLLKIL